MQSSAKINKFSQSEYLVGILSLQASSCIQFYHKMSFFRRKVQLFVGGQYELTLMTLMQSSAKINNFSQSQYIIGVLSLQASSWIQFCHKMRFFRRKVQIFVGGQYELTLVTLMQNIAKITKIRQSEHIFGNFNIQASSCIHSLPEILNFLREVQVFAGGQSELFLVTLMQNSARINKFRQRKHIFGNFSLQASSCIHSHPKILTFLRKVPVLVGDQNELTLMTLMQSSAKINKFSQSEDIVGVLSLQASSCIQFHHKKSFFRRKVQIFVGGQYELTLVTLTQNCAKTHKFCQREHIFGNFSLQVSSCIHSHPKLLLFCWKVQVFVGGQNELTLMTLMQSSAKINNFSQSQYIIGALSLQASSWIQFYHKMSFFRRKVQIFVGGQYELTLVTLMQNSAKITKIRQSEHIFGNFNIQASSCIHSLPEILNFLREVHIFAGGQSELFLVTLMQNSAKINKFRQRKHIFGNFSLQASSCIHSHPKILTFLRKVQVFVGGQNELTLMTLMQSSAKINKFSQSEYIIGILSLQASSCIHFLSQNELFSPKSANFCRRPVLTNFGDSHAKLRKNPQVLSKRTHFWQF